MAPLTPGHHYVHVVFLNCRRVVGLEVTPSEQIKVSLELEKGSGIGLDAYDNSLAGTLPGVPLGDVYLVTKNGGTLYPTIRTSSWYDFEFVPPREYFLDMRLTDGTLCQVNVSFRRTSGAHRIRNVSTPQLLTCIDKSPPSGL